MLEVGLCASLAEWMIMARNVQDHRHINAVAESLKRCERKHGLLPDTTHPIMRLQSSEVTSRYEEMVELTGGRRGIFRQLADAAVSAEQCFSVSDADGVIVRLESQANGPSDFSKYGISLGSCWKEGIAGTNGISMAMVQNKASTVRGSEHFYSKLHPFACTATPLFDAENKVIGAINISTVDRGVVAEYLYAQKMLDNAAEKIQRILFKQHFKDELIVSVSTQGQNGMPPKNELIAIDEIGNIQGTTVKAYQILQQGSPSELIGKSFQSTFGKDVQAINRAPERVFSTRLTNNYVLNLSVEPQDSRYSGRGWQRPEQPAKQRLRRRLPLSMRELAVGSKAMSTILDQAHIFFQRALPFIVEGETGTGKSSLISALHDHANLSQSQLVTLDCSLQTDDFEGQGYVDDILDQARVIIALGNGEHGSQTLVLDNIDDMTQYAQARLCNLLTELENDPVVYDDLNTSSTVLRIVALCRNPLLNAVEQGTFREDLYFLLCNARYQLPPLRVRERPEALAQVLANKLAACDVVLSEETINVIKQHSWPGNIRELRNALRQSLISGEGRRISLVDIAGSSAFSQPLSSLSQKQTKLLEDSNSTYDEKNLILDALVSARWNISQAARKLAMGRATIHRKMKQYAITRPNKTD